MSRALTLCGAILLATAGVALCDQKAAGPPASGAARGGIKGNPKAQTRLVNPANPATRLFTATAEERDRALEKMTPQQQQNARQLWLWYDRLPKDQQALQLRRLERFEQLTPGQRAEIRGLLQQVNELQPPRRMMVGEVLQRLQTMSDAQRNELLGSSAFKERFSADEQRIIARLADAWLPQF
jgi:hypothetical protein